jgi:hypothetical protein
MMWIVAFWFTKLCGLVGGYHHFSKTNYLEVVTCFVEEGIIFIFTVNMMIYSSEMLVSTYG